MSAPDEIRRLSDELARDPSSLCFLQLGELLRKSGQRDMALKVALRGLERHAHNAQAHDLLARVAVDRGELDRAFDEWDMVLRLSPGHVGAKKGMGFICFRQGRLAEAERYLADAASADAGDASIASALAHVRGQLRGQASGAGGPPRVEDQPPTTDPRHPSDADDIFPARSTRPAERPAHAQDARSLFADVIGDGEQTVLLLDAAGLVMAGAYVTLDHGDVGQEVGAELSGVSEEAQRAMRHLDLGSWTSIVFETEAAIVAMAPAPNDGLLLVAAERQTPLGFVRRLLDRAAETANAWLGARR